MFTHTRTHPALSACLLLACLLSGLAAPASQALAGVDEHGTFSYSVGEGIDQTLAQIALYLIKLNRREGNLYTSAEFEPGIVGYQIRFFDNLNNEEVDSGDWLSVRRYRIPAQPDTTLPAGYYRNTFIEYVDVGLDGMDKQDYYFINGRRFDLHNQATGGLQEYQIQIESGVTAFLKKVGGLEKINQALGVGMETSIRKQESFDDGSLPAQVALGLDLKYVFRPFAQRDRELSEAEMVQEIRREIGFVYSASTGYTDVNGYRFQEIAAEEPLLQRSYDPMEVPALTLLLDALFDTDGDGIISEENIRNGRQRFREIHQELSDNARGMNRRIVLPNEKLARLRREYENVHKKPFEMQ